MKTFWKSSLIVLGLAFGAVAGSGVALADNDHHNSGKSSRKADASRMPPAVAIYRNGGSNSRDRSPHVDKPHKERDHSRDRVVRRDRDHDHDRARSRGHGSNVYVYRHNDRDHDRRQAWARYDHRYYGYISPRRPAFSGYGARWMWWGGNYNPYNPPAAYRNCYPVVSNGWYHGRRARYGGTMCYNARGTYLLPNSTFIINIY